MILREYKELNDSKVPWHEKPLAQTWPVTLLIVVTRVALLALVVWGIFNK